MWQLFVNMSNTVSGGKKYDWLNMNLNERIRYGNYKTDFLFNLTVKDIQTWNWLS